MKKTKEVEVADCCWKVSTLAVCWVTSSSCIIFFRLKITPTRQNNSSCPSDVWPFFIFFFFFFFFWLLFIILTHTLSLSAPNSSALACGQILFNHALCGRDCTRRGKNDTTVENESPKAPNKTLCVCERRRRIFSLFGWFCCCPSVKFNRQFFLSGRNIFFYFYYFGKGVDDAKGNSMTFFSFYCSCLCSCGTQPGTQRAIFKKERNTRNQIGPSPVDGSKRFPLPHRPFLFFWQVYHQKVEEKGDLKEKKKHFRNLRNTFLPSVHFHVKTKKSGEKYTKISHGILSDPIFSDFIVTICVFLSLCLSIPPPPSDNN